MLLVELIGWIAVCFTLFASEYFAFTQKSTKFVWAGWTIGSGLALIHCIVTSDWQNMCIYLIFSQANAIGIWRLIRNKQKEEVESNETE